MSCPSPMWGGSYLQVLGVALPIVFTVASLTSAQTGEGMVIPLAGGKAFCVGRLVPTSRLVYFGT